MRLLTLIYNLKFGEQLELNNGGWCCCVDPELTESINNLIEEPYQLPKNSWVISGMVEFTIMEKGAVNIIPSS